MSERERSEASIKLSTTAKQGPTPCIEGNGPHTVARFNFCADSCHRIFGTLSTNNEKSAVRIED